MSAPAGDGMSATPAEWAVMSGNGQVHVENDRNLAEISVREFRIHGQPAYLVSRTDGSKWEPAEEDHGETRTCHRPCDCVNAPEGSPNCRFCDYKEATR